MQSYDCSAECLPVKCDIGVGIIGVKDAGWRGLSSLLVSELLEPV